MNKKAIVTGHTRGLGAALAARLEADGWDVLGVARSGGERVDLDGERSLRYASQYFDTPRLDSYFGAVHGRRRRFKVRARSYLDSGGAFLEVKTRGARSATVKERVPVSLDATADALDDDAVSYATELLTDAGIPGRGRARIGREEERGQGGAPRRQRVTVTPAVPG